jgi:hypothetical protein
MRLTRTPQQPHFGLQLSQTVSTLNSQRCAAYGSSFPLRAIVLWRLVVGIPLLMREISGVSMSLVTGLVSWLRVLVSRLANGWLVVWTDSVLPGDEGVLPELTWSLYWRFVLAFVNGSSWLGPALHTGFTCS